jgi:hypothetical protein
MSSMRDNWVLGGVLGGAALFFWGMVSHLLLPIGELGVRTPVPAAEPALVAAMKEALPERALYLVPGSDPSKPMDEAAQKEWLDRMAAGPTALVAFNPGRGVALGSRPLSIELVSNLAACIFAAWLLTRLAPGTLYFARVGVVAGLGLFAVLSIELSYWAWYAFPTPYLVGQLVDQVVGYGLAGLVVARHARPAALAGS